MSNQNIRGLYELALNHLETGKSEESVNLENAVKEYASGVRTFETIASIESDSNKISLIRSNIDEFKSKIIQLNQLIESRRAGTAASTNTISNVDANKTRQLFTTALSLDEALKQTATPYNPVVVQQCIDAYLPLAEALLKDQSQRSLAAQIIDRIEALKKLLPETSFTSLEMLNSLPTAPSKIIPSGKKTSEAASNNNSNIAQESNKSVATNINSAILPSTAPSLIASATPTEQMGKQWVVASKTVGKRIDRDDDTTAPGLTEREIYVLRQSSSVNGKIYMPWLPNEEEQERFRFDKPFCDPDGQIQMSPSQIAAGAEWRRPTEFITEGKPVMIQAVDPLSIRQHLVSDCSFVCSLCIAAAFEAKFKKRLITSIIYPQNASSIPVFNAYGKYLVKLFINGVKRKVVVDDRLPYIPTSGKLACSSSINPLELWVSIVEKAYMKVNGGYDFPGSNSDVDLFALTGWIPEHVYFQEPGSPPDEQSFTQSSDRAWQRIKSAHKYGDCLITIGTGPLTAEEEKVTGLVPSHAYAVLDVREAGILRMLQVKNPWSSRPFIGRFSSADRANWTVGLMKALGMNTKDFDEMEQTGMFWIEFSDCLKYFPGYYLNWNPNLFSFRTVTHDIWPLAQGPKNDTYFIGDNPQFCLVADCLVVSESKDSAETGTPNGRAQTLWVLLTRHVKERGKTVGKGDGGDFVAVHVHGLSVPRRLYGRASKSIEGVYTNGVHTLVRIDADTITPLSETEEVANGVGPACETLLRVFGGGTNRGTEKSFTLVLSQRSRTSDFSYTVHVFGTVPFKFYPSPSPPPHKVELSGSWTPTTCGNQSSGTFHCTPQYRLVIPAGSPMHMHLQILFPKEINGKIFVRGNSAGVDSNSVGGGGDRVDAVEEKDEAMSSGTYRPGYCCCDGMLLAGTYVIILSTYEVDVTAKYMFTARGSKNTFLLAEIEQEGHRGYATTATGAWRIADGSAAGCSNYGNYDKNPLIAFCFGEESGTTKLTARLRASTHIPVNLSLFQISADPKVFSSGYSPMRASLPINASIKTSYATSNDGVYTGRDSGVVLHATIPWGTWVLLPSTFEPTDSSFEIKISFSTTNRIPFSQQF